MRRTIITPVPGIRFYDLRPELSAFLAPLRAENSSQVNHIYRSFLPSYNRPHTDWLNVAWSRTSLDKTPAGKIKDTVSMQTILTIFVVCSVMSFDPFYFSR